MAASILALGAFQLSQLWSHVPAHISHLHNGL